ncbi:YesL family protein [Salisediminibacterium beveridgei]|uniref:Membrane protein YesL n=1 Tax=Salisediminibacterium beveridgei TaxID=632773 RepID=A0A1D7QXM5_9BACI|nr:DUF624 domain-containing protein [Salisediminibacterium beveridgei]AOM83754.1 hypothetical protein BBEV_2413 [Salisediminibacterium beveridgei]
MKIRWLSHPLYRAADLFTKLVMLNFLWAIFTLAGLIVFGLFPATVALFSQMRRITWKDWESASLYSLFHGFYQEWKQYFIKANTWGLLFYLAGTVLFVNWLILPQLDSALQLPMTAAHLFSTGFLLVVLMFWFPAFIHYELKWMDYLKVAFLLPFKNILSTFMVIAGVSVFIALLFWFPPIISFAGISGIAWLIMSLSVKTFTTRVA